METQEIIEITTLIFNKLFHENSLLVLTFYFLLSIIYLFLVFIVVITAYVGANIGPFGTHPLVIRLAFIPGIIGSELSLHFVMFMSTLSGFLWKINLFNYFYYLNVFSLYIMVISSVFLLKNYLNGFTFAPVSKTVIDQFYLKTNATKSRNDKKKSNKILVRGKPTNNTAVLSSHKQSTRLDTTNNIVHSTRPTKNPIVKIANLCKTLKKQCVLFYRGVGKRIQNSIEIVKKHLKDSERAQTSSHLQEPSKLSIFYWFKLLIPIPSIHFPNVHRVVDIPYGNDDEYQRLDVFFHESCSSGRPILVYVHGGGWKQGGGKRSTCGLPLIYQMASKHWIVFSIGYRLAPDNKFPTHIHDTKKAIQWIRDNAAHYGGDIDSMFIAGGSAGGHLASLTCLTDHLSYDELFNTPSKPNESKDQDEKDDIYHDTENDTTPTTQTTPLEKKKTYPPFRGCVSYYAVYDFTNRHGCWTFDFPFYLGDVIMRSKIEDEPELFKNGSPLDHIKENTKIPFLVIHGDYDELVPIGESLQFIDKYRETVPNAKVTWLPVPGAHHAFDLLFSPRTIYAVYASYRYLNRLYKLHQHEKLKLKQLLMSHKNAAKTLELLQEDIISPISTPSV
ncbi:hypothetical protein DLAC_00207 [Tieghemostelium lacteum]|uniref:BD-FAE-like domain-containing protein n=1 Tax=Tieghemostelium lacteum TaxID=361077 RepID=A0A152A939_TIELA|nr:hypothetical protein DLAC_00207 [Tieghemostelium lacteum]|eukprot:KYR02742.1 hypothetical protein DLAC_00207 [Tieghemostelium lacteum]